MRISDCGLGIERQTPNDNGFTARSPFDSAQGKPPLVPSGLGRDDTPCKTRKGEKESGGPWDAAILSSACRRRLNPEGSGQAVDSNGTRSPSGRG